MTGPQAVIYTEIGGVLQRVGTLWAAERRGRSSFTFQYDDEWARSDLGYAIEPALPLVPGSKAAALELFGGIADSAPDRWGRSLLARAERSRAKAEGRAPRGMTELQYVLGVSDRTRSGALRFAAVDGGPLLAEDDEAAVPPIVDLPKLLAAAEGFLANPESEEDLKILLAPGSSLGGARPKASVRDDTGCLSIAKFPKSDDPYSIGAWEHLTLGMARDAGISTTDSEILRIDGKDVVLLRRFDRQGEVRIPMISAMAMLDASPQDAHSYLEIAEAIQRWGGEPRSDLLEIWRRMVFGVLVSNTDDHLRNHAFLLGGPKGWVLSPAYDINPTPAEIKPRVLATALGENEHDTTASLEIALDVAGYFDLDTDAAWSIIRDVAHVTRTWKARAQAAGRPKDEIDRLASAFEHEDLELALG